MYTFELTKQGQKRRDRITWSLLGISLGLGIAIAGYTGMQFWDEVFTGQNQTEADPFAQATSPAMDAAELTQTAESSEDWVNVALQWQKAIAFMEAVPKPHPNYALAQEKIQEYQRNLQYAEGNVAVRAVANPNQQVYWTLGSDRDRVIAVQGVPSQVSRYQGTCREVLYFGNSTVELQNGYVKTYSNFDNNLKTLASNQVALSVQPQPDSWSLGSSRTDVISVQGTPTRTEEYATKKAET
ncbi:hypothetical protein C7271_00190, partial [filamentous cyanobacterium CCP5]